MTIVCGDERAPKVLLFTENYQFSQPMNIDMRYLVEIAKLNILSDIKYIENLNQRKEVPLSTNQPIPKYIQGTNYRRHHKKKYYYY